MRGYSDRVSGRGLGRKISFKIQKHGERGKFCLFRDQDTCNPCRQVSIQEKCKLWILGLICQDEWIQEMESKYT